MLEHSAQRDWTARRAMRRRRQQPHRLAARIRDILLQALRWTHGRWKLRITSRSAHTSAQTDVPPIRMIRFTSSHVAGCGAQTRTRPWQLLLARTCARRTRRSGPSFSMLACNVERSLPAKYLESAHADRHVGRKHSSKLECERRADDWTTCVFN